MNILITGGLGHIGSKLIREIPRNLKSSRITILDNLLTQRFCSLFNLKKYNYSFINTDVSTSQENLEEIFKGHDIIVHLAAITDAAGSFDISEEVERNNFESTKIVSDICSKHNIKLIFVSSTSVYGTQNNLVNEDISYEELRPQSPYAVTKIKEENYLRKLSENKRLNYVICRFGTIYGISEGMRFHTAINKFCWQAVLGEPITVWRTALNQKRPYLYLNDASNAILHIMKNDLFDNQIYNILTDNLTVQNVINEIRNNIKNINLKMVDHEIMNQLSYEVEKEKIIKTGFKFNGSIKVGIKETINLLKNSSSIN